METKSINQDFKIIKVARSTHKRLDALHQFRRETFDEIIVRLIDSYENGNDVEPELVEAEEEMHEEYQPTESEINNLTGN